MSNGLTYNYAAKQVNKQILSVFKSIVKEDQLLEKYESLYNGEVVNLGEKRMVLHQLTRGQLGKDVVVDGINKRSFYEEQQKRIADFADKVHSGKIANKKGEKFNTVVQIGRYHLNKRDGLRYPSYVRTDSEGRRVRGDKFIVTQNGKCCFQPPQQKVYNVISFIKEHPEMFSENKVGMSPDRLVNLVCNRLLNQPIEDRPSKITEPRKDGKPFNLNDYDIHKFNPQDRETQKRFYPYFKFRGIDLYTQYAFHRHFCLATKHRTDGLTFANLAFPLVLPKTPDKTVGFRSEE